MYLRIHTLLIAAFFLVIGIPTASAQSASVTVEQVSASDIGVWTLIEPDGSSAVSTNVALNQRRHTESVSTVGRSLLSVTPPPGMSVRITAVKNGKRIASVQSRQYSFLPEHGDEYRLIVQYRISATGTLGVISDPQGVIFRMKSSTGRTYRAKTPFSYTNLPIGKYTIQAHKTETCFTPAPQNVQVTYEERRVVSLSLTCEGAVGEFEQVERERISRRTIRNSVHIREAMRKSRHLINSPNQ